jgi:hypothetical protein
VGIDSVLASITTPPLVYSSKLCLKIIITYIVCQYVLLYNIRVEVREDEMKASGSLKTFSWQIPEEGFQWVDAQYAGQRTTTAS